MESTKEFGGRNLHLAPIINICLFCIVESPYNYKATQQDHSQNPATPGLLASYSDTLLGFYHAQVHRTSLLNWNITSVAIQSQLAWTQVLALPAVTSVMSDSV